MARMHPAFISLHVCQKCTLQKVMQHVINTCYKDNGFHTCVQIHKDLQPKKRI